MVSARLIRYFCLACSCSLILTAFGISAEEMAARLQKAVRQYALLSSNYQANLSNTTAAWKFSEACFDLAEFATNDTQRATLAQEGIAVARKAIANDPSDGGGHFYLALNLGQLARTRLITALGLVRDMERAFIASIKADEKFDNAAAHRSLGMLYVDAPGWPASVGSRSKGRRHLERAIELAPLYPDNNLTALETWARWKDKERLRKGFAHYERILPQAREKYTGEYYEDKWRDWDERWEALRKQAKKILDQSSATS
jgi:tetratricopeptide (TPR) repeat protein